MTTPSKTFKEKYEENLWKTLWEKPKYYWYIRQNSSKPNEKNKKKLHDIQSPMLLDLLRQILILILKTPWPYGQYASNIIFQKSRWEKLDDIAYTFVAIASSKTLYEKPQKEKLT